MHLQKFHKKINIKSIRWLSGCFLYYVQIYFLNELTFHPRLDTKVLRNGAGNKVHHAAHALRSVTHRTTTCLLYTSLHHRLLIHDLTMQRMMLVTVNAANQQRLAVQQLSLIHILSSSDDLVRLC